MNFIVMGHFGSVVKFVKNEVELIFDYFELNLNSACTIYLQIPQNLQVAFTLLQTIPISNLFTSSTFSTNLQKIIPGYLKSRNYCFEKHGMLILESIGFTVNTASSAHIAFAFFVVIIVSCN